MTKRDDGVLKLLGLDGIYWAGNCLDNVQTAYSMDFPNNKLYPSYESNVRYFAFHVRWGGAMDGESIIASAVARGIDIGTIEVEVVGISTIRQANLRPSSSKEARRP